MTVPGIVEQELGDEDAPARVPLGGDDELFVTPTRALVYRSEGLLSDESVEEYPHDADRLAVSEGRRKSKVQLEYAVDGQRAFAVPTGRLAGVLEPVLAGVLNATGVTDDDERIEQVYRFSELTLVITNERLLKHIGSTVWDDEYESYHFEDVTDLTYEEGSVATGIVLTVDGRSQRIKAPNDRVGAVREQLESSLFSYRNVSSADQLGGDDEDEDDEDDQEVTSFDAGVDPLETGDIEGEGEANSPPGDTGDQPRSASTDAAESAAPEPGAGDAPTGAGDAADDDGGAPPSDSATETGAADPDEAGASTGAGGGEAGTSSRDEGTIGGSDEFSWGVEPANVPPEVAEQLAEIREAIERQNDLLADQQRVLQRLLDQQDEQ